VVVSDEFLLLFFCGAIRMAHFDVMSMLTFAIRHSAAQDDVRFFCCVPSDQSIGLQARKRLD